MDGIKWLSLAVKGVDRDKRTLSGRASTSVPDYEGEVILPSAWKESLKAWKKLGSRPKFIVAHRHALDDGHSPVLGPINSMEITGDGLDFEAGFAQTELGNEYLELYSTGAMDAFSVGFVPQEREFDAEKIGKLLEKNGIDAKGAPVRVVTTKAHILEVSAVVVGMNQYALVKRSGEEIPARVLKHLEEIGLLVGEDGLVREKEAPKGPEKFEFQPAAPETKAEGETPKPVEVEERPAVIAEPAEKSAEILAAVQKLTEQYAELKTAIERIEKDAKEWRSAQAPERRTEAKAPATGPADPDPFMRGLKAEVDKVLKAARDAAKSGR